MKSRELNRLPLSVVDCIIKDIQSLQLVSLSIIRDRIRNILASSAEVNEVLVQNIMFELEESNPYLNVFHGLQTQAQQLAFFRKHFALIVSCCVTVGHHDKSIVILLCVITILFYFQEPVEIVFGTKMTYKYRGRKRMIAERHETMAYIPILKTIETFLNNDTVIKEVHVYWH